MKPYTVTAHGATYDLVIDDESGAAGIFCKLCLLVSYHPQDIAQKYCGHCHRWHEIEKP